MENDAGGDARSVYGAALVGLPKFLPDIVDLEHSNPHMLAHLNVQPAPKGHGKCGCRGYDVPTPPPDMGLRPDIWRG
jgi:hypothetical protein